MFFCKIMFFYIVPQNVLYVDVKFMLLFSIHWKNIITYLYVCNLDC